MNVRKPVFTRPYRSVAKRLRADERISLSVSPMDDIPANANPFLFDPISMGTDISRAWTFMMQCGADGQLRLAYMVNTKTGQRFRLNVEAEDVKFDDEIYVSPDDWFYVGEQYTLERNGDTVNFFNYDPQLDRESKNVYIATLEDREPVLVTTRMRVHA